MVHGGIELVTRDLLITVLDLKVEGVLSSEDGVVEGELVGKVVHTLFDRKDGVVEASRHEVRELASLMEDGPALEGGNELVSGGTGAALQTIEVHSNLLTCVSGKERDGTET